MKKFLFLILLLTGFGTAYAIPPITLSESADSEVEKICCMQSATAVSQINFQTTDEMTEVVKPVPISGTFFQNQQTYCNVENGLQLSLMVNKSMVLVEMLKVGEIRETDWKLNASQNLNGNHIVSPATKGKGLVNYLS